MDKTKEYDWLVDGDKCPYCGSEDVSPVENFDHIKKCNKCHREFQGDHN